MSAIGQFPVRSNAREVVVGAFSFTINGTSDPDGVVDPGKVLASGFPKRGAAAEFQCDLADKWTRVFAAASYLYDGVAPAACVSIVVEGTGTNQIWVRTSLAGSASESDNKVVQVLYTLIR